MEDPLSSAPDKSGDHRRADRWFRQFFEHAADAAFVHDVEGRIIDANAAACASLGYAREELLALGVPDIEVMHTGEGFRFWRELHAGDTKRFEGLHRRKDGSTFPVEVHVSVLETEGERRLLALARNASERKHVERLLHNRVQQQQAIARLGAAALGGSPLDTLFDEALRVVGRLLELELCRVLEHVPGRGHFILRAGLNAPTDQLGEPAAPDGHQYVTGYVLRTGKPVIIEDFATESRFEPTPWLLTQRVVCGLSVPIGGDTGGSPRYGILAAYSRERHAFTDDDVYFVLAVANVLAAAIDRRRGEDALRAVEARYLRVAANTSGMVFHLTMKPDTSIMLNFVSEGCRPLYELEPAEMRAEPRWLHWVVHPEEKEGYRQTLLRSVATLEPFRWEGRVLLRSGTVRWVTARAALDSQPNGDVLWNGMVLDVSELVLARQAMLAAKEEAEKANHAKSEFLSRMSHELRTPLNAILGFGQLLELSPLSEPDAKGVGYILKAGRHLVSLVDEVLDIARVEAGELGLNTTALSFDRLAQECAGLVARSAQARGITCTVETGAASEVLMWADEQRLRQVLLNLLSNAIKYNRPGGQVFLRCEQRPAGQVRLEVSDTGFGILPEGLSRLFSPFERIGQESGEVEGTGLGLVVSRRLVEAMGGRLGVDSQPGRGSTFWVELPIAAVPVTAERPGSATAATPAATPAGPAAALLYIEDNASNVQVVQMMVERLRPHWEFFSAPDGQSGLRLARERPLDVLLLDLQLPGMGGDLILAELRSDPVLSRLPVLMLSADATSQSREGLLALGADDYLSKPFDVETLLGKIDTLLRRGLRPELDASASG